MEVNLTNKEDGQLVFADEWNMILDALRRATAFEVKTAAQWQTQNPKLPMGTFGIISGTLPLQYKVFNGVQRWNEIELEVPGKGDKGDAFKYTDFTQAQLDALKGQKGDAFKFSDFTEAQLNALKVKGDPGTNGWTPSFRVITQGAKAAIQLFDYTGGSGAKPTTNINLFMGATGFGTFDAASNVMGPPGVAAANQPLEVELVKTRTPGMINSVTGEFIASSTSETAGFISVAEGEKLIVTYKTAIVNPSPPATYSGITGYSSNNYGSFVTAIDTLGFPKGTLHNVYRYNAVHGSILDGEVVFKREIITVPAGVKYVNGSSNIAGSEGVSISIKAIRNQGTLPESLGQLFDKVNAKADQNTESGASESNFTEELESKLKGLPSRTVTVIPKGLGFAIELPDTVNGTNYIGFFKNGVWTTEGNLKNLRSFPYPIGYAFDKDKVSSNPSNTRYTDPFNGASMLTAENGLGDPQTSLPTTANPNGTWNFTEAETVMAFAISKGITRVHHAHGIWATAVSRTKQYWKDLIAANPGNEKAALLAQIRFHVRYKVNYMKNKFPTLRQSWNIMNEFVESNGSQKESYLSPWCTLEEITEAAFTGAREGDPDGEFYMNDYEYENSGGNRTTTYINLINGLKAKNIMVGNKQVQVDGIGSQMHTFVTLVNPGSNEQSVGGIEFYAQSLKRLADTGLKVMFTELDFRTGKPYNAEAVAKAYYLTFQIYERIVPQAQRGGIVMWSPTDDSNFININKGYTGPDGSNPANDYPALYDWYGQPKLAVERLMTLLERPQLTADVYQDFVATGSLAEIAETYTGGKTPLKWTKSGYTAGTIRVNALGLSAAQTGQNSTTNVTVNYPYPNRLVWAVLWRRVGPGQRTTVILLKFKDANNYIAFQATNNDNIWTLMKRVNSQDTRLLETTITPAHKDELQANFDGPKITCFINGNNVGQVTETDLQDATSLGFRFKGFDDKFTGYGEIMAQRIG